MDYLAAKRLIWLAMASMFVLGIAGAERAQAGKKVAICHVSRNRPVLLLNIDRGLLKFHLHHGDFLAADFFADDDGDGLGDAASAVKACKMPAGFVTNNDDCDDSDATVGTPTQLFADTDGDTFGDADVAQQACPGPGLASNDNDCDDTDPTVHPDAEEGATFAGTCTDGKDNDCDGLTDSEESDCVISFQCPPSDLAGFPLGESDTSVDPIFCSYPVVPGEDPFDFYCAYSATDGHLVQDNDAGLCPPDAVPAD